MKKLILILSLFVLSGCESIASMSVSSGHYYPYNHINYTLGYYSDNRYNGYPVYGSYGYRYYYAPRGYTRHYRSPPRQVVVQHVHSRNCGHNYTPPRRHNFAPPPRRTPRAVPPRTTPPKRKNRDRRNDRQHRK